MKPPPRKRNKVTKEEEPPSKKQPRRWSQSEQRRLISALKTLNCAARPSRNPGDPDYDALAKAVRTRTESEVKTYVESLMDELVSVASAQLKNTSRWGSRNRKPIELWTRMASRVTGDLEAPITAAFSKMLIVCSTEPLSQLNSDPPKVHRPPSTGGSLVACSLPVRPMVLPPSSATNAGVRTAFPPLLIQTPPRSVGPTKALPQVIQVANARPLNPTVFSAATPPRGPVRVVFTPPRPPSSPAAAPTPVQSAPPSPTNPSAPPTSKSRLDGNSGVKNDVDFERIYQYLGLTGKPDRACKLTSMESAIVLDLLMSLPEELSLLDCSQLKKHLVQVYQCLSSNAGSKKSQAFIDELKMKKQTSRTSPLPDGEVECRASKDQRSGQTRQEASASWSPQTSSDSGEAQTEPPEQWEGLCPPLNPFMIPLKLLRRK
ncbi:snRNA-activating protein complex subunit 2 [Synchiropus splendidus]|uniref:snRNA-activating protein complex subunit 2 n=1 Tax=Synchiropus splendidus TaxID=270530 RepID=UPI00237EB65E|nr:snRNA-activating protein complex subunit 2 [Synchiropus splendidus]